MAELNGLKVKVLVGERAEKRACMVSVDDGERKALFHCWSHQSRVIEPAYAVGDYSGGTVSYTMAIVEMEDGKVFEVYPSSIRFLDTQREMAEIASFAMEEAK